MIADRRDSTAFVVLAVGRNPVGQLIATVPIIPQVGENVLQKGRDSCSQVSIDAVYETLKRSVGTIFQGREETQAS